MSHPSLRRHLPCTLSATVTQRGEKMLVIDFDLAVPALGFSINTKALVAAEALAQSPVPEEALFAVGKTGLAEALKLLRSGALPLANEPAPTAPAPPPIPVNFAQSDAAWLRELGIEG